MREVVQPFDLVGAQLDAFGCGGVLLDAATRLVPQAVGTVPPSMTYSVPVIAAALGEVRNAMRSATSRGLAGRPSGMPPSDFMMICLPP